MTTALRGPVIVVIILVTAFAALESSASVATVSSVPASIRSEVVRHDGLEVALGGAVDEWYAGVEK
jgi:hypothetical protein